jgi:hypothetical protein
MKLASNSVRLAGLIAGDAIGIDHREDPARERSGGGGRLHRLSVPKAASAMFHIEVISLTFK